MRILISLLLGFTALLATGQTAPLIIPELPDIPRPDAPSDTIIIIHSPDTPVPDDLYGDESVILENATGDSIAIIMDTGVPEWLQPESINRQLTLLGDSSHDIGIGEFAVPAGVFAASALFVRTPWLIHYREVVQKHLSQHGKHHTEVDNWIQYAPMVVAYALPFTGYRSQHNLLDRTILLALSYATFGVLNNVAKFTFKEQRPDSGARNSFPSGHTGTTFMGAEYLRREYWDRNKWVAMSGYAVGVAVGYMRIYNDRHWINDVVGGAAIGYLSTTFAYWLYPKIFRKRTRMHRDKLLERLTPDRLRKNNPIVWSAAPFAANGSYGIAANILF